MHQLGFAFHYNTKSHNIKSSDLKYLDKAWFVVKYFQSMGRRYMVKGN